jgi:hypothetical protein
MSARTTPAAVQSILGNQYDGTTDLAPFIATASPLVDWVATKDVNSEMGVSMLERVECYLSAHFYAHADQITQSKSTSRASDTYQGQTAMVFMGTQYGQTACALDLTGTLAKRSKEVEEGGRRKASVTWLGEDPDNQAAYQ